MSKIIRDFDIKSLHYIGESKIKYKDDTKIIKHNSAIVEKY